ISPQAMKPTPSRAPQVAGAFSALSLRFETNRGQASPDVQFVARHGASAVLLTGRGAILKTQGAGPIRLELVGSRPTPVAEALDPLSTRSSYFIGRDPVGWRRDIPNFARVRYRDVWPGIDLVYYGTGAQLEYDFVVAPGSDPRTIAFAFKGGERVRLASSGDLLLANDIRQRKP